MTNSNFSRRRFLKAGAAFSAISVITPQHLFGNQGYPTSSLLWRGAEGEVGDILKKFQCPQWFKDAKFGLWLHWGPQSIPEKGGGWYARHLYSEEAPKGEEFGEGAWEYHRQTFGHQSEFGYKDLCNLWKAEKFDADATLLQFKKWGARYAAIMAQHHDNFDLFNSSVHRWNATRVGPKRDILGEFAAAARKYGIPWMASSHGYWANWWYEPAFGADKKGFRKDVPYDGNLTLADGKGKWWEGLDPQQLYAHKNKDFEKELTQRLTELVENYQPDVLYFDNHDIPAPALEACKRLYGNSLKKNGSIQTIITVKRPQAGTVLDFEKGIAEGIQEEYWQTDTSLNEAWFQKSQQDEKLRHDARTIKELFVDIISKRGVLMLNLPVNADGSIPDNQRALMDEVGAWINGNQEAIYATEPWKIYGEGGESAGGHFNERTVDSTPWSHDVRRFTRSKDGKTLFIHVFGNPASRELIINSLADKKLFRGKVKDITLLGSSASIKWSMKPQGLSVVMPDKLAFSDCNVLKIKTTGL
jgi:alpha-L-fucosidase